MYIMTYHYIMFVVNSIIKSTIMLILVFQITYSYFLSNMKGNEKIYLFHIIACSVVIVIIFMKNWLYNFVFLTSIIEGFI